MGKNSIRLGSVFGIPIGVDYSWFVILLLIGWSLYGVFTQSFDWTPTQRLVVAAVTTLLFFASLLAHELSHSIVARSLGIPVHSITLFIFGGVSQISKEAARPRDEFLIAVVGPLTSFLVSGLFFVLAWALQGVSEFASGASTILAVINLSLGVFNLVPGFPLDGGRVLRAVVWGATHNADRATRIAATGGKIVAFLMIGWGAVRVVFYGDLSGIWFALIGWFLFNAASQSQQQVALRNALAGLTARDLMSTDYPLVPGNINVEGFVYDHLLPSGRRFFLVGSSPEDIRGVVTLAGVKALPRSDWAISSIQGVMLPLREVLKVAPGDTAFGVVERLDGSDVNQVLVVEDGRVLGVIGRDRIIHQLMTRAELGA